MKIAVNILALTFLVFTFGFKPVVYKNKKLVVIDAGHGGRDIGFYIGNAYEKQIVAAISGKIMTLNKNKSLEIILIREGDVFTSLDTRLEKINQVNPDLVISLHLGSSNNTAENGVQAYIHGQNQNYEKSRVLAESLITKVADQDLKKGEVYKADFALLKQASSPAVTLELGFLSNQHDRDFLMSEKGQKVIAKRILASLNE